MKSELSCKIKLKDHAYEKKYTKLNHICLINKYIILSFINEVKNKLLIFF
jgi:phage-related protein